MLSFRATVLVVAMLLPGVAPAAEGDPPSHPSIAFKPPLNHTIDAAIVPAYERLVGTASTMASAMDALCAAPDAGRLAAASDDFAALVGAWSGVEMFRFGPVREANRYERLFFWPDPRGRGLQQVQALLAASDEAATVVDTLQAKSVAVQGLLALEYVLHGTGAEALETPGDFRCRYGAAIAGAVALTAAEVLDGWTKAGGYADLMRNASADDPVYRSHGEAAQELIKAAREQLQLVRDGKLAAAIGATPEKAQPKRAPFWRSSLTLPAIAANLDAVTAIVGPDGVGAALPADKAWAAGQVAFELGQVDRVLGRFDAPFETLAAEPGAHADLLYTLIPLGDVTTLLETDYLDALGLIAGFNSLDGD